MLVFLKEFTKLISEKNDAKDPKEYRPTQVLTKNIQRKMNLQGIMFNSSKAKTKNKTCYVLFVTNRNCIDPGDEVDMKYNQLVIERVVHGDRHQYFQRTNNNPPTTKNI